MRSVWTRFAGALTILGIVLAASTASAQGQGSPQGQGQDQAPPEFQQIRLTDKQVQGFIAAQKDLSAIASKLQSSGDKGPDPKVQAELEQIAKKNGFKNFEEFDDVAANISMIMAGLDPQSGQYSDPTEMIKKEMAEVRADKTIADAEKKQTLAEMEEALKSTPPLKYPENVTVVKKYQKDIEKALQ